MSADFHVVINKLTKMFIPNHVSRISFVITEPPEVQKYDRKFLEQFGTVFAPNFNYLSDLGNVKFGSGFYPHQAGYSFIGQFKENFTVAQLHQQWKNDRPILISAITSSKKQTKYHGLRLDFINYLRKEILEFEVFGRGFKPIEDKASILLNSKYHLALENSDHPGWWTEKLLDPIICGSQVFWAGDNSVTKLFKSVVNIDLNDFEKSKNVIKNSIEADLFLKNSYLIEKDYFSYIRENNIFTVIESWISMNYNFFDYQDNSSKLVIRDMINRRTRIIKSIRYRMRILFFVVNSIKQRIPLGLKGKLRI